MFLDVFLLLRLASSLIFIYLFKSNITMFAFKFLARSVARCLRGGRDGNADT